MERKGPSTGRKETPTTSKTKITTVQSGRCEDGRQSPTLQPILSGPEAPEIIASILNGLIATTNTVASTDSRISMRRCRKKAISSLPRPSPVILGDDKSIESERKKYRHRK